MFEKEVYEYGDERRKRKWAPWNVPGSPLLFRNLDRRFSSETEVYSERSERLPHTFSHSKHMFVNTDGKHFFDANRQSAYLLCFFLFLKQKFFSIFAVIMEHGVFDLDRRMFNAIFFA